MQLNEVQISVFLSFLLIFLTSRWCTHLKFGEKLDFKKLRLFVLIWSSCCYIFLEKELWFYEQYFLEQIWNLIFLTPFTCNSTPTSSLLVKDEVFLFKHLLTWRPSWFLCRKVFWWFIMNIHSKFKCKWDSRNQEYWPVNSM